MGFDKPLLVVGAGGQLGVALSDLVPGAIHLDRKALDITDRDAVGAAVATHKPEVIVNAAAYTRVDAAEADPEAAFAVNTRAVGILAEAASRAGALLVQPSTDYVFPGTKQSPYVEDDATGPLSVYGKSKLEGEEAALSAGRHLVVRTSWVFGQGANFIRSVVGAAKTRDELTVVDDQWGLPTYAPDLAEGLLRLVDSEARGIYHLAGGGAPATWAGLAEFVIEAAGIGAKVRRTSTAEYYAGHGGPVAPRPAYSVLDCSKAAALGVELRPWREAVVAYLEELA
jgi:dTDP-4-dehydrorhamnose reductase